jgi:hypothetical protein
MPLSVQIGGDTSGFERAMVKAQAVAAVTGREIARRFEDAAQSSVKSFATRAGAGLLLPAAALLGTVGAFKAIGAAVEAAKEQVAEFAAIAERANRVGVNTTFLQVWEGQAKRAGLSIDNMTASLEKAREVLTARLGQSGEANDSTLGALFGEHIKAGNITSAQAAAVTGAGSPEARIKAILDLVNQLRDAGRDLAAFDIVGKVFGPKFEDALRRNLGLVQDMRRELDKPTVKFFDEAEIARGERLNERLHEAENTIRTALKPLYDDLARFGVNHHASWVSIVEQMASAARWAGELYAGLSRAGAQLEKAGNSPFWRRLEEGFGRLGLSGMGGVETLTPELKGRLTGEEALRARMSRAAVNRAQEQSLADISWLRPDVSKPLPEKEKKERKESLDQIERFVSNLEKQNELLRVEFESFGKSNTERERSAALVRLDAAAREAGRAATDAETDAVKRQAEARGQLLDKLDQQRRAVELQNFAGSTLVDALDRATEKGAKLSDIMADVANAIKRAAIQALVLGQGPLSGLFGTAGQGGATGGLIGLLSAALPKFQQGGLVPGSGPMPAIVHGGEMVVPKAAVPRVLASATGGPSSLSINVNVSGARGNREIEAMVVQGVTNGLKASDRAYPARAARFNMLGT